jgi:hypothetical protein
MDRPQDLYEILGVAVTATPEEIRAAFRKKARQTHPDMEGGSDKAFAAVNEAHTILSDPERRKEYDASGTTAEKPALDEHATMVLVNVFSGWIDAEDAPLDPIAYARQELMARIERCRKMSTDAQRVIRKLQGKLRGVRMKNAARSNALEGLVNSRIGDAKDVITTNDTVVKAAGRALQLLEDYEFKPPTSAGIWGSADERAAAGLVRLAQAAQAADEPEFQPEQRGFRLPFTFR